MECNTVVAAAAAAAAAARFSTLCASLMTDKISSKNLLKKPG
jgi:hypothetical protein